MCNLDIGLGFNGWICYNQQQHRCYAKSLHKEIRHAIIIIMVHVLVASHAGNCHRVPSLSDASLQQCTIHLHKYTHAYTCTRHWHTLSRTRTRMHAAQSAKFSLMINSMLGSARLHPSDKGTQAMCMRCVCPMYSVSISLNSSHTFRPQHQTIRFCWLSPLAQNRFDCVQAIPRDTMSRLCQGHERA